MPFNMCGPEMLLARAAVLVVFYAGKLSGVTKGLGGGVRESTRDRVEPPAADHRFLGRAAPTREGVLPELSREGAGTDCRA